MQRANGICRQIVVNLDMLCLIYQELSLGPKIFLQLKHCAMPIWIFVMSAKRSNVEPELDSVDETVLGNMDIKWLQTQGCN